ncbi:Uncharacterised protein [uncultured Ruminococcus sp.]|uniref:hypothetical protein n=1 Tax=Huintestinicola butyrica TaxID=2981728 RepID=UPI000822AE29|nr:hypothetical protein [Huintestinicola butyrica]MCU6727986.1 hypothetical protein [Huintestinicola butyrica]MEE0275439.1 hypothetical protein [Oscillospiraceae bacterium]SCI99478.1 Uncharacterised protein [uncultured Ruminococcus sp.]
MNEENEKSVNEITNMGGDISPDEGNGDVDVADVADAADIHALEEQVAALTAENAKLRNQLFCEREGIPRELTEDIICAASARAVGGVSFEEAARDIFGRISKFGGSGQKISTGVRSRREGNGDDVLRRAFGLK